MLACSAYMRAYITDSYIYSTCLPSLRTPFGKLRVCALTVQLSGHCCASDTGCSNTGHTNNGTLSIIACMHLATRSKLATFTGDVTQQKTTTIGRRPRTALHKSASRSHQQHNSPLGALANNLQQVTTIESVGSCC